MSTRKVLSEYESRRFLESFGVPPLRESLVRSEDEAAAAAAGIGYPVVLKGCAASLAHKTELGLVKLNLCDENAARKAFAEITGKMPGVSVLVQEMVPGNREFIAGMSRQPGFDGCVMFGLGGIFVEVLRKTSFRVAPLERLDAIEMIEDLGCNDILGAFRGEEPVRMEDLANLLVTLGRISVERPEIVEIDINPVKIAGGRPVAVDALVVTEEVPNHA